MAASIPRVEDQEKKEGESLNTFYDQVSEGVHHYFQFFGYDSLNSTYTQSGGGVGIRLSP